MLNMFVVWWPLPICVTAYIQYQRRWAWFLPTYLVDACICRRFFPLTEDFSSLWNILRYICSHTHLKRSQILSLVFRHRLCLNTFMGILVIHWIALKRQLIVVNSVKGWSVFLSMYIYVWQGGGSCPPVLMYKLMYISCLLTVIH